MDTSSIEAMERTARNEEDCTCSVRIGSSWLEVHWDGGDDFTYKWNDILTTRVSAIKIHSER